MHAYVVDKPGGDFRKVERPHPALRAKHVLVRVQASGVNPLDTKIRAGKAEPAKQPLPAVLGFNMAGIVEEVAAGVSASINYDHRLGRLG